jgi:hypothetical protein
MADARKKILCVEDDRETAALITAQGKPRSKYGLGNDFAKWVTEAGLPKRCRLHGLKKGGMRRLAEAGGTAHELMAFSGHKTLTEVQRYTTRCIVRVPWLIK